LRGRRRPRCLKFPDQLQQEYGTRFWDDTPVRISGSGGTVNLPAEHKKATRYFRGIKPDTINRFGVYLSKQGRVVFPYHDSEHKLIGYKTCSPNKKDFRWGDKSGTGMFGVLCAHSKYRLFLTEGEFDAMALKDLTGDCAVSVSCGAGSLVREYKRMLPFVESFDDVFVVMDNDEPGRQACEDLKPHVDQAKVHFVQLPDEIKGHSVKDINDVLLVAQEEDFDQVKRRFLDCVYASKNAVPEDVYDPSAVAQDVVADMFGDTEANKEISTGVRELDDALGGWRAGELTTIIAPTSIGKSTFTRAVVASLINRGHKCMIFSLEEPPRVTVRKIVELIKGDEIYYANSREEANEKAREVTDYLVVYNKNGRVDPATMGQTIDFAVRGRGVEFVLLDNLTRAIDQSDPYNSINQFLDKLTEVSVATGVHSICVSHTKRMDNSTNAPTIQEARGSGLIEALSSNIISLGRNRDEHRMHVCLLKNREYGTLTETYLDYDPESKRFTNMEYFDRVTPNIQTVNRRETQEDVYIGRGSVLGNPFPITSEQGRDKVIEGNKEYLHQVVHEGKEPEQAASDVGLTISNSWTIPTRQAVVKELQRIERKSYQGGCKLGCYCKPEKCHGDNIVDLITNKGENYEPQRRTETTGHSEGQEERESERTVSTGQREDNQVRQQGGSQSGTSNGGQRGSLPQDRQGEQLSTDSSGESEQSLPGLRGTDDQGAGDAGGQGPTSTRTETEDDRNREASDEGRLPLRYKVGWKERQNAPEGWHIHPSYRPVIPETTHATA